jgi:hypothetical protein
MTREATRGKLSVLDWLRVRDSWDFRVGEGYLFGK